MLTTTFPMPHNTSHYFDKAKAQRAQVPLRSQLSLETFAWRRAGRPLLQEVPAPRMNSELSQLLTLPALLASGPAALTRGMQPFPAPLEREVASASPF